MSIAPVRSRFKPEDFFCPICQDTMTKVSVLWCNHAYCTGCIFTYWKTRPDECPLRCRLRYHLGVTTESAEQILKIARRQGALQQAVTEYRQSPAFKKAQRLSNRAHKPAPAQQTPAVRFAAGLHFATSLRRNPFLVVSYRVPITKLELNRLKDPHNDEREIAEKIFEKRAGVILHAKKVKVLALGLLVALQAVSVAYLCNLPPAEDGDIRGRFALCGSFVFGMIGAICIASHVLFNEKLV